MLGDTVICHDHPSDAETSGWSACDLYFYLVMERLLYAVDLDSINIDDDAAAWRSHDAVRVHDELWCLDGRRNAGIHSDDHDLPAVPEVVYTRDYDGSCQGVGWKSKE